MTNETKSQNPAPAAGEDVTIDYTSITLQELLELCDRNLKAKRSPAGGSNVA